MKRKTTEANLQQPATRDLEKRIATLEAALREKETIEVALRESESRYRTLVENLNDVVYTLDPNGCFTYISPAIEHLSAYKIDDLIGRNFSEFVHPDDLSRSLESLSRTIRNEAEPFEFRVFDRDGQVVRYIRSASQPVFHDGLIVGITGLMTDITARQLAEEELRKNEENTAITLQSIGDGVISTDIHGLIVNINLAAEKLCGWDLAEAAGKPLPEVFKIINSETRETVADPVKKVLESGEIVGLVNHTVLISKDGTEYQIADSAAPIKNKEDEISGVVLVFSDVTETYVAQKQIKESEERYRRLLQNLEAGIVVHAPNTAIVMNNPRAVEILGLSDDQMSGKKAIDPAWKFVNDDKTTLPLNDYPVNRIVIDKKPIKNQILGILQPGKNDIVWVTVNGFPVLNNTGDITEIVISFIDITKAKMAEEKNRESEMKLKEANKIARLGNWELNIADSRLKWSEGIFEIFEIDAAKFEVTYEAFLDAIHPDDRERVNTAYLESLKNKTPYDITHRLLLPDGRIKWVIEICRTDYDAQGNPVRSLGIVQDITARKQLEAENQKLTEQFYQAQKMDSIGQLAGGIAHDFNNLLVPIIGYAELGLLATPPDSNLYGHFEQVKRAGERAANLTRQILAFSRRQVLEMTIVDLNQVVLEFEKMLGRLIGEHISLKTHLADNLPAIKADPGQLEQVLLNLVVNARDAMPEGGRLILETTEVMLDEAYAAHHPGVTPGAYVMLTVSDTGQGMDPATQQRIFEPFFTTKARGHGTGLGLSTVFGIVKQHGGNIWVYSEPGQGTTFKVYLPVAETAGVTAAPAGPADGRLAGDETIMVVEDEAAVRDLVISTLEGFGYRVLAAGDPPQALALAAAHPDPIHLLLTDVIMPGLNGRELYQQLSGGWPGLKVVYMSGYTDDAIAHHGVLDEGVAFLQKPFAIRRLLEKVRAALG